MDFGMIALDYWTEVLRCPVCASTGVAHLSQKFGEMVVETVPQDFDAVSSQYGETFYCKACNRPASTSLK